MMNKLKSVFLLPLSLLLLLSLLPFPLSPSHYLFAQTTNYLAPDLENCTPDQSGNSYYTVASFTAYFYAHWEFVQNTNTFITCTAYIPVTALGATIVLDINTADNTAGHTVSFNTCDAVIGNSGGTLNIGALTCGTPQVFTTTTTANARVTLTFNVQSTLATGNLLIVKVLCTTSGSAPTAPIMVYPHFQL